MRLIREQMFDIIGDGSPSCRGGGLRHSQKRRRSRREVKNCAWRLGSKYGAAYMEDNTLAAEVLKMEGVNSKPSDAAMATYYSPKGKAFAWQIRFSMDRWDKVARKLGMPVDEKKTTSRQAPKAVRSAAPKTQRKTVTKAAAPAGKPKRTRVR